MDYKKRIADNLLKDKLNAFGAVHIIGPKGCGKTTTAKKYAKSFIELQDEDNRDNYLLIANTKPSDLLKGEKPRLIDEWQDAPKIWGAIRKEIDDSDIVGEFILTGSSSNIVETPHTGTLRISRLNMYSMSLYESGESSGEISLIKLLNGKKTVKCHSKVLIDDIKYLVCRGGWPGSLKAKSKKAGLEIAKDLFNQICEIDISNVSKKKRNPKIVRQILKSYARNICTLANAKTIIDDVNANHEISKPTYYEYIEDLEKLFIINDIEAWNPSIRSKTSMRSSKKKNFTDPSIAAAALGINPEYFDLDYKTLGFLFESLCLRDLNIYILASGGYISYYHDRMGLEADAVLHLANGRYALVEIKLSEHYVEEGAKNLCNIEKLIIAHNKENKKNQIKMPEAKIVITGSEYGYRRDDGVLVIPIGCLKP